MIMIKCHSSPWPSPSGDQVQLVVVHELREIYKISWLIYIWNLYNKIYVFSGDVYILYGVEAVADNLDML